MCANALALGGLIDVGSLRKITTDRESVKRAMAFALDHADEAAEVVEVVADSLSILETPIPKKIARLFAVSDILYNSSQPVRNASMYRTEFQQRLPAIFQHLHDAYAKIDGRITANTMKVGLCLSPRPVARRAGRVHVVSLFGASWS